MRRNLKGLFAKTGKIMFILAALIWVLGAFVQVAWSSTYYMPDDFSSFQAAFAGMSGGDTLIVRDNSYTKSTNQISNANFPPSGTDQKWTTIKAEHAGGAIFGNPDSSAKVFSITDKKNSYVKFEGMVWLGGVCDTVRSSYIKFIKCGVGNNYISNPASSFQNAYSSYCLYEDCYAWGSGRYRFLAYRSDHIVFRRCIGRTDATDTTHGKKREPIGGIALYWTTNCEAQNCIIIDSVESSNLFYQWDAGAFTTPNQGGDNNIFRGCIALNCVYSMGVQHAAYTNTQWVDMIGWDLPDGGLKRGTITYNHMTVGNMHSAEKNRGGINGYESTSSATNCIFTDITTGLSAIYNVTSDYNSFYGNSRNYTGGTKPGAHDITDVNPLSASLKYLPRIESGTTLSGAASDGGDIGATIIKKIGVSGSLWGEAGYNTTTNENLWPFPNEELIREKMRTYRYDDGSGGDPEITGIRGFCADGQTLTKYIWGYLGNPIPPEIYGVNAVVVEKQPAKLRTGKVNKILVGEIGSKNKKKIRNKIGMAFSFIPKGTFTIGILSDVSGTEMGSLPHQVTLTKGFYIQNNEVTQGQWKMVMGTNPSFFKDCGENCPVEMVSWENVQEFIKRLNKIEVENKYRLPTEAEWEYACRAGTDTPFSFGQCLSTEQANYWGNHPFVNCKKGIYRDKTEPVDNFPPNPWGLSNMHGNVWEWCQDWLEYYNAQPVVDPKGPSNGSLRVIRGGGWNSYASACRSGNRSGVDPKKRFANLGFRLVIAK